MAINRVGSKGDEKILWDELEKLAEEKPLSREELEKIANESSKELHTLQDKIERENEHAKLAKIKQEWKAEKAQQALTGGGKGSFRR
jgi:hypothetical protein